MTCHCRHVLLQCPVPATGKQACVNLLLVVHQHSVTALVLASTQRRPLPRWGSHSSICDTNGVLICQNSLQAVLQAGTLVLAWLLVDRFRSLSFSWVTPS